MSDSLLCLYPETVEDAMKSAVEITTAYKEGITDKKMLQEEMRIAIHHGRVKLGSLHYPNQKIEMAAFSDTLTTTQNLQKLARKLGMYILTTNEVIDRVIHIKDHKIGETTVQYCRLGRFRFLNEKNSTPTNHFNSLSKSSYNQTTSPPLPRSMSPSRNNSRNGLQNPLASSIASPILSKSSPLSGSAINNKDTTVTTTLQPSKNPDAMEFYEVYDRKWNNRLYSDERKREFLKGVNFFQHRKFIAAMNVFNKLYKANDADQISRFYMRVCKMYQQTDLPSDWDGTILLDANNEPNPMGSKSNSFYLQSGITAYFYLGDEQVLSGGKDKEEEIRLLNDSLSEKSVTIKDMKSILSVKEQEISRLNEITELLIKEKRQEVDKVRQNLDKEKKRVEVLEKKMGIEERRPKRIGSSGCFPWLSGASSPTSKNKVTPVRATTPNNARKY
ncbi:hypothetical protein AKO1_005809, partial [Acrasis kona]